MTRADLCPSCGTPRTGRYCAACGERALDADDLTLKRFIQSLAEEFLTGLDPAEDRPVEHSDRPAHADYVHTREATRPPDRGLRRRAQAALSRAGAGRSACTWCLRSTSCRAAAYMVCLQLAFTLVVAGLRAMRRLYGSGWAGSLLRSSLLMMWHLYLIVFVFRFGLFYTTYYSLRWFG